MNDGLEHENLHIYLTILSVPNSKEEILAANRNATS